MKYLALIAMLCGVVILAAGQTPSNRPAFEVASIKLSKMNEGTDSDATTGRLRMQGTLKALIWIANEVSADRIIGGPSWIDQDHYDIDAKADGPADAPLLHQMLQTLLADRFQLQVHREARTVSGYSLVVAKGGLKMKQVEPGQSHGTRGGRDNLTAENIQLSRLAARLTTIVGAPVVDETGNTGYFDFTLKWAPDRTTASPDTARESDPSIFTALQEQLGLKLERGKVSIEMIVVDHAARPTLN